MKYLLTLLLMFALNANALSGIGTCTMEHDIISTQSEPMPCHDAEQDQSQEVKPHLCDCDMSAQYVYSLVLNITSSPIIEAPLLNEIQHNSLVSSPMYRPPIRFSS
jgi:hypothetical protein